MLDEGTAAVIAALGEQGVLLKEERYAHKYPYDWRTKLPTIFRATPQARPGTQTPDPETPTATRSADNQGTCCTAGCAYLSNHALLVEQPRSCTHVEKRSQVGNRAGKIRANAAILQCAAHCLKCLCRQGGAPGTMHCTNRVI